jgi:hypothetical protein
MKAELSEDDVKFAAGMDLRSFENGKKDASCDVDLNNMNGEIVGMMLSSYESCMARAMVHDRLKCLVLIVAAADNSSNSRMNMEEAAVHSSLAGIDMDDLF